jgi:predicted transposase YbfD/YdcC
MDSNTLPPLWEAKVYQPLLASFARITDLRCKRGVRYHLKPLLIVLFLSKLGGADRPAEIADWVKFRFAELKSVLGLEWKRSPHEVTWKRLLENGLDAEEVEKVFAAYLRALSEEDREAWNLDGKVVRGVKAEGTGKQLHLVALQEAEGNAVEAQTALQEGENEISAGFRLVGEVDVAGKIITGDAMFAQRALSRRVVEQGGDYLWKLRANQGHIYDLAVAHFALGEDNYPGRARTLEKGHGRLEERVLVSSFRLAGQIAFPYLAQVFRISKTSLQVKTGKQSEQTTYGLTSLPVEEYGAEELLALTRGHWRIENGLHYRRDVTFQEDAVRKKSFNGGQIMAALNNLAIGLLRKIGWENIAQARRYYEAQFAKGWELISNPIIV